MNNQKKPAFHFIFLLGLVSLFGDITYEGARSVIGPYLSILGASAVIVGFISGIGEFLGYALRLVSGYVADRTRAYWPITIIGYASILSIPLVAFVGYWQFVAFLMIVERIGKAIRTPARDAMLSHATIKIGRGIGFAIHEALDQIGAIIGPLIFSAVFIFKGGYKDGFMILWIPALLTMAFLFLARMKVPSPERFETSVAETTHTSKPSKKLPGIFWCYAIFIFFGVAGFTNFQLIAYHLKVKGIVSDIQIPIFYAIAMGVDAVVALIIGRIYDKIGFNSLITIPILTLPIPVLAFSHNYNFAIICIVLWGAVMGIHETIMRASIADIVPIEHRGTAYGIFNTIYGVSWFIGSVLIGFLYEISINSIFLFVLLMQVLSTFVFFILRRKSRKIHLF